MRKIGVGILIVALVISILAIPITYQIAYWRGRISIIDQTTDLQLRIEKQRQTIESLNKSLTIKSARLDNLTKNLDKNFETIEQYIVLPDNFFDSNRTGICSISGGPGWSFTHEIKLCPYKNPREGEIQAFSVWVSAGKLHSPIKEVTATIPTTNGNVTIQLTLVEGDKYYGRWVGFWIVRDILWREPDKEDYYIYFVAINEEGEKVTLPFAISRN